MGEWPSGFRVMVTGHRDIRGERADKLRALLLHLLGKMQERHPEGLVAVSGMAVGTDIEFADAALNLGIPLVAAIPTESQDRLWPPFAQERYQQALSRATMTVHVWEEPGYIAHEIGTQFHMRNKWMIDNTPVGTAFGVWDGRKSGGTWAAIREIFRRGRKVLIIDPRTMDMQVQNKLTQRM